MNNKVNIEKIVRYLLEERLRKRKYISIIDNIIYFDEVIKKWYIYSTEGIIFSSRYLSDIVRYFIKINDSSIILGFFNGENDFEITVEDFTIVDLDSKHNRRIDYIPIHTVRRCFRS